MVMITFTTTTITNDIVHERSFWDSFAIYLRVMNIGLLFRILYSGIGVFFVLLRGSLKGHFEPDIPCHGNSGVVQCV